MLLIFGYVEWVQKGASMLVLLIKE